MQGPIVAQHIVKLYIFLFVIQRVEPEAETVSHGFNGSVTHFCEVGLRITYKPTRVVSLRPEE